MAQGDHVPVMKLLELGGFWRHALGTLWEDYKVCMGYDRTNATVSKHASLPKPLLSREDVAVAYVKGLALLGPTLLDLRRLAIDLFKAPYTYGPCLVHLDDHDRRAFQHEMVCVINYVLSSASWGSNMATRTLTIELRYSFHKDQEGVEQEKNTAVVETAKMKARELLATAVLLSGGLTKPDIVVHSSDMFLTTEQIALDDAPAE